MFGSTNPFGQSNNAFGSPSAFGQPSNTNNPFGAQPFGANTSSPFGSQQPGGNSMFGGTSTGVFGASQPAFGASSSPGFGSSAFGASSTPAFGTSGSSVFGQQKPAFGGGFGTNPTQASPFGSSTFQQPQPAFGAGNNNLFGSTPTNQFGASSQPAFGASSTPAFGATSTPAFGAASTPAFGTPSFGATSTPAFGSTTTPAFGSTGSAFGSGGAFGVSNTTPAFGTPGGTPAFGASSTPSFSFGSTPAFGQQSASTFGSATFGATPSPFGAQSSSFGTQATTPAFGQSGFGQSGFGGQQRGGSRVAAYSPTAEVDSNTSQSTSAKLESISAMPVYKEKSHEELRWEDYQLGDKGGPSPAAQPTAGGIGFGSTTNTQQSNPFGASSTFGQQSSPNPFSSTTPSNPFGAKPSLPFGNTATATFGSSPFGASTTSNPFGSTTSAPTTTNSIFGSTTSAFGTTPSSTGFGQSPSIFGSTTAAGTTSGFSSGLGFGNTQSSPLFQSTTPSLGQTNSVFGQIGQSSPAFGQSNNNIFSTPSTGFGGNMFSSTPSLISTSNSMGFGPTTPSFSTPFQSAQPAQTAGSFGFGNIGQTQSAGTSGFGGTPSGMFGQNTFGQSPAIQSMTVAQPAPVTNPFGTLPAMPQMSIGRSGTAPTVQYGISSLPVVDKPAPVRISSLLTSRHLSQSRIRLPARRYHPKNDKVPFFNDDEETPSIPKADALFIPRENPRALVIRPLEQWPPKINSDKKSPTKDMSTPHENGEAVENGKQHPGTVNSNQKQNGEENNNSTKKNGNSYEGVNGSRAGEAAAIVYEHGAGIEALLPKLRHPEYYTEPRMQELAAKERAEPGFCRHVKDFVIGRHGFGSIRFIGETDVRALDIESLVQFNNREVIVYLDEDKKPPVGQGLNKPAEVTLLNIKGFDKKTGNQYTEGPKIDRYIAMLKKKTEDQDAKFVSYDPVKGEWKFRVNHFSKYCFGSEDEDPCDYSDC